MPAFRDYLLSLNPARIVPPALPCNGLPKQTKAMEEQILQSHGTIPTAIPPQFLLEKLYSRICSLMDTDENPVQKLDRYELRHVPWVLFFPPDNPQSWLANKADFLTLYFAWADYHKRPSILEALLHELLRHYPTDAAPYPLFRIYRDRLRRWIEQAAAPREILLLNHCMRYFFLDNEGSTKFGGAFLKNNASAAAMLQDAGLVNDLATSGFVLDTHDRMLQYASQERRMDNPDTLKKILDFVTQENALRFPERRAFVATCLLEPFSDQDPPEKVKKVLKDFMLKHLSDPRLNQGPWHGVSRVARAVMQRWMVGTTLEDFFRLLDLYAARSVDPDLDRMWKYRKAFWMAYYRRGYITEAWVALGPEARRLARGVFENLSYAELIRGGIRPSHSALILKIGNIIITEWSHQGMYRFFLPDNPNTPRMYRPSYSKSDLVATREEYIHSAPMSGSWQANAAGWLERHLGIRVSRDEYMRI